MANGSNDGEGVYTVLVLVAALALAVGVGVAYWGNGNLAGEDQAHPFEIVD